MGRRFIVFSVLMGYELGGSVCVSFFNFLMDIIEIIVVKIF